jgi:hypothetical protein
VIDDEAGGGEYRPAVRAFAAELTDIKRLAV